jgi:Domain of unknown function (DUF697)
MLRRLVVVGGLLALVCSAIFVINQTAQVVSLANTVSPVLARVVLGVLLTTYALVTLGSVVLFIRLPKPMAPPANEQSSEYQAYLRRLGSRLANHPDLVCAGALNDRISIDSALKVLDAKADEVIKGAASALFVATAVSQSGDLDALMVLAEQARLIWRVAHVYNQRPTLRDFGQLYANVGASVFAATKLEDLDIAHQVMPVVHKAIGHSIIIRVPGVDTVASFAMQCVLDGTANAYLTLRVGIICQTYCRSITAVDRRKARRNASLAAASMLGSIVSVSAASVVRAILAAATKAAQSGAESAATGIREAGTKLNPFKAGREK